jgi:signal transduction histidine kinase
MVVQDEGVGIPPEIRDKIFNLYFTTKESGTGVGLAMTYRIMQLHSGTITVDSEVGKGSTFRLELPEWENREVAA